MERLSDDGAMQIARAVEQFLLDESHIYTPFLETELRDLGAAIQDASKYQPDKCDDCRDALKSWQRQFVGDRVYCKRCLNARMGRAEEALLAT